MLWTIFISSYISSVCNLYNSLWRHKAVNLQKQSKLQHLKLHLSHQVLDLNLHTELLVKPHLNLHQTIDLRQQLNLQLHLGPTGSLHPHNRASISLERHVILYHLRHLCFLLFCLFFSSYLLLLDHLANCWILVMQPSASMSTSGVPSQVVVVLLGDLKAESLVYQGQQSFN